MAQPRTAEQKANYAAAAKARRAATGLTQVDLDTVAGWVKTL